MKSTPKDVESPQVEKEKGVHKAIRRTVLQQIEDKLIDKKMDLSDLPMTIPVIMTYTQDGHQLAACTYNLDFLRNAPLTNMQSFTASEKSKMVNLLLACLKEGSLHLQHVHFLLLQMYGGKMPTGSANPLGPEKLKPKVYQIAQTLPEVSVLQADDFLMQIWLQMAGPPDRVLPKMNAVQLSMRSAYVKEYGLPVREEGDFSYDPPEWMAPKSGYIVSPGAGSSWYHPAASRDRML